MDRVIDVYLLIGLMWLGFLFVSMINDLRR